MTRGAISTSPRVRVLTDADLPAANEMLSRRPVVDVFVASRVAAAGLSEWRLGAQVWGYEVRRRSCCPCVTRAPTSGRFVRCLKRFRRSRPRPGVTTGAAPRSSGSLLRCFRSGSSYAGRGDRRGSCGTSSRCWFSTARRSSSPIPQVRLVQPSELDVLLPAAVAMFTEEIGVPPESVDLYRARVAELIAARRCFARIEDGRVLFKAEVGAATVGRLPDPGRVGGAGAARSRSRDRRYGGRRGGRPARHRAGGQPLRQRASTCPRDALTSGWDSPGSTRSRASFSNGLDQRHSPYLSVNTDRHSGVN